MDPQPIIQKPNEFMPVVKSRKASNVTLFLLTQLGFICFTDLISVLGLFLYSKFGEGMMVSYIAVFNYSSSIRLWVFPVSIALILITIFFWKKIPRPSWVFLSVVIALILGLLPFSRPPSNSYLIIASVLVLLSLFIYVFSMHKFLADYKLFFGKMPFKSKFILVSLLFVVLLTSFLFGYMKFENEINYILMGIS